MIKNVGNGNSKHGRQNGRVQGQVNGAIWQNLDQITIWNLGIVPLKPVKESLM